MGKIYKEYLKWVWKWMNKEMKDPALPIQILVYFKVQKYVLCILLNIWNVSSNLSELLVLTLKCQPFFIDYLRSCFVKSMSKHHILALDEKIPYFTEFDYIFIHSGWWQNECYRNDGKIQKAILNAILVIFDFILFNVKLLIILKNTLYS